MDHCSPDNDVDHSKYFQQCRNGDPLQCSCLENPADRGAWTAAVHRVAESDVTEVT